MYWQGIRVDSVTSPLVGEPGFVPVRRPRGAEATAEVLDKVEARWAPVRRSTEPGVRVIGGRRLYSAAWL